jgi:hypothetical protein
MGGLGGRFLGRGHADENHITKNSEKKNVYRKDERE